MAGNGPFKKESSGIQKKIQKVKLECLKEQRSRGSRKTSWDGPANKKIKKNKRAVRA